MRALMSRLAQLLHGAEPVPQPQPQARRQRGATDHIILLDGTMASLAPGTKTNIGILHDLLRAIGPRASVYYGKGLEWREWRDFSDAVLGWGVDRQIRRAYGWLATRYRPGDRIFLLGYSRGAFAARSLAGLIDRVGLVRAEAATERNIRLAWRYYVNAGERAPSAAFRRRFCHEAAEIEMVGVFDTVSAIGLRLPVIWMMNERQTRFHDQRLGPSVKFGAQALAIDETRSAFEPVIWDSSGSPPGRVEQVWFRGTHPDIGGQLADFEAARPLANIPLVWMIEHLEARDVALPLDWRLLYPCDPAAPSIGSWRAWGKMFLLRAPRVVGRDPSERLHETAIGARRNWRTIILPQLAARLRRSASPVPEAQPVAVAQDVVHRPDSNAPPAA
ncbi:DUF2235 domain-containing protein [Phaeovulum sp. W22_SRMD_FR3]|uniref:DUF2235 domain-containing protein n=1 Tax=Phaeovulum sp. W22_SRMD_FR3 TaxID=3240274 RepID=UPI003F9535CB